MPYSRKLLLHITAFCTAIMCCAPCYVKADDSQPFPSDYIINITFDEDGTGTGSFEADKGGTIVENGAVSYSSGINGNALNIAEKSADNYLSLPEGILEGCDAATYSFWLKPGSDELPNWPFMTTCDEEQTMNFEKYLGMLATTTYYTTERYNNSGTRLSSVTTDGDYDQWKYVTVVFDHNSTSIYVNGMLAAQDDKEVDVSSIFTPDSKTWVGHANWGSGEGFSGMIDDFKIYGRALTEDEIHALAGDAYTEELEKYLLENNRLVISTNFFDGDEKILQIEDGLTVTAKTTIENLRTNDSSVSITLTPYGDNGILDGAVTESYDIPVTNSRI